MYINFEEAINNPKHEDFSSYTNKQLIYFENLLSKKMQEVGMFAPESDALIYTYDVVHEEMQNRGLTKMPQRGL